jgi:hypothetical protein
MAMVCTKSKLTHLANGKIAAHILCTFDTTPGTAVDTVPDAIMAAINSGFIHAIYTKPGGTGPTDNADVAIADADGKTIWTGTDKLHSSNTLGPFLPAGPTTAKDWHNPMGDGSAWTITITNNAVNNSTCEIILHITPSVN